MNINILRVFTGIQKELNEVFDSICKKPVDFSQITTSFNTINEEFESLEDQIDDIDECDVEIDNEEEIYKSIRDILYQIDVVFNGIISALSLIDSPLLTDIQSSDDIDDDDNEKQCFLVFFSNIDNMIFSLRDHNPFVWDKKEYYGNDYYEKIRCEFKLHLKECVQTVKDLINFFTLVEKSVLKV